MKPYGYYWWRGRVIALTYQGGRPVALVPRELVSLWRQDIKAKRISLT